MPQSKLSVDQDVIDATGQWIWCIWTLDTGCNCDCHQCTNQPGPGLKPLELLSGVMTQPRGATCVQDTDPGDLWYNGQGTGGCRISALIDNNHQTRQYDMLHTASCGSQVQRRFAI